MINADDIHYVVGNADIHIAIFVDQKVADGFRVFEKIKNPPIPCLATVKGIGDFSVCSPNHHNVVGWSTYTCFSRHPTRGKHRGLLPRVAVIVGIHYSLLVIIKDTYSSFRANRKA